MFLRELRIRRFCEIIQYHRYPIRINELSALKTQHKGQHTVYIQRYESDCSDLEALAEID